MVITIAIAIAIAIGVLYSIVSAFFAIIVQHLIDIAVKGDMSSFVRMVIFTCVYIIICGLVYLLHATLCKKIICRITQALRFDVFKGVFKRSISDFKSVNSADYISALTNDVKLIEDNFCIPLLQGLLGAVDLVASAVILIYFSPIIFATLVVMINLITVIPRLFNKILEKGQSTFSNSIAKLTILIKDFMSGFEVITSYGMTSHTQDSFDNENKTTAKAKYAVDSVTAAVEAVSTVLGTAVLIVVFCVAVYLIIKGNITVGILVGVLQVSGQIVNPIQTLSQSVPKIQSAKSIIKRLSDLRDYQNITLVGIGKPAFNNEIAVNNICFQYENGNEVLRGMTCRFEKGKKYAIIGKSGCGKTTLVNLLNGYFDNYIDKILFDTTELHNLDIEKINEMIAVIHQNVYMFDTTIQNNICLYKDVPSDSLKLSLEMSGVNTFLDEGTSAIDLQTAFDIESRLLDIDNLTVITITHSFNPDLLRAYDSVIFMSQGKCTTGTFDELIERSDTFNHFFMLNKDKEQFE